MEDNIQVLGRRLGEFESDRQRLLDEKRDYLKKMDLLIGPKTTESEIQKIREAFQDFLNQNEESQTKTDHLIKQTKKAIESLKRTNFSWAEISKHATRVQEVMAEKDPAALKRAYRSLFDSIVIGPEDEMGCRTLSYVLKDWNGSLEDVNRLSKEMVEVM